MSVTVVTSGIMNLLGKKSSSSDGLEQSKERSYHSMSGENMASAGGGRSFHGSNHGSALPTADSSARNVMYEAVDVVVSTNPTTLSGAGSTHGSAGSLTHMMEKFLSVPLHVRGRAEAWEIPRQQIKLTEKLGEGETGCVYKCRWRGLDCAVKVLTQNSRTSIAYYDMVNEVSTVSHLRHPNLVLFLGACTKGDEPLMILNEYMGGGNLEDKFGAMWKQCGHPWRPTRVQAFKWIKDLTKGITFLHNCHIPIVHRDLKPANLLLTDEDHLKVADFGLCKTLQKVQVDGKPYTMTGKTGTMRYMAPEVVKSEPFYDEKVDIYSMAMIFWYILHGVRPFEGVQPNLVAELTSCRGIRPSLEGLYWPEMANMISRMWSDKPTDRPSSKAILDELNSMCVEDLNGNGSASEHKCSSKGCVPCAIM